MGAVGLLQCSSRVAKLLSSAELQGLAWLLAKACWREVCKWSQLVAIHERAFQGSFDKLWGYANVVRLGAEHLTADGTIVLVSGAPARKCKPGQVALSCVGGAVENLVRAVAPELAQTGRRINAVSPGLIETPMFGEASEARTAKMVAGTANNAIKRAGQPEEVAKGIMFVIENNFVTGTTVDVDGGWLCSM